MFSILSSILGFATAGLPSILGFFQQKGDQAHEREMAKMQNEQAMLMAQKGFQSQEKIAAIGVRLKKWISFHGISINLNPDLSHFEGIVPCGIQDFGVTSLHKLGKKISMVELDEALKSNFEIIFGHTTPSKNLNN